MCKLLATIQFSEAKEAYEKAILCSEAAEASEASEAVKNMPTRASITDPANSLFWQWDEVQGVTAEVDECTFCIRLSGGGSTTAAATLPLEIGEVIRIGSTFVTYVAEMIPPRDDDSDNEKCCHIIPNDCCVSGLKLPVAGELRAAFVLHLVVVAMNTYWYDDVMCYAPDLRVFFRTFPPRQDRCIEKSCACP